MNSEITPCTDFLTSKSSYITGIGTVFNLAGNYYDFNYSQSTDEADRRAIESDWKMVGKDLKDIFKEIIKW
jgi:hypothetical protein